jgi:hypothetical protein
VKSHFETNRVLKNAMSDGLSRQILPKKRSLWVINEYFEGEFNALRPSGACGKFGDKLFTATGVRARQKNAGIAGPTSSFSNAAMAAVAKKSVIDLSARPTSAIVFQHPASAKREHKHEH